MGRESKKCFFLIYYNSPSEVQDNSYSHRGTRGRGGRLHDRPCFAVLQLHDFEKILPFADSFLCALQDEVNIMGCSGAGGPVTSSKMAAKMTNILEFA